MLLDLGRFAPVFESGRAESGCARESGFATDSALEGDGFELPVPPVTRKQFRRGPFAHSGTAVKTAGSFVEVSSQGYSVRTPF